MPVPSTPSQIPSQHLVRWRVHVPALVTAAIGAVVYVVWRPPSTDLANQTFRAAIFGRSPFAPWNNLWFAGHHTPGDYLLTPPLGSVLGTVTVGVIALLAAALAGSMLVHHLVASVPGLRHPQLAGVAFAVGSLASLYGGRTAFLLGSAFGAAALLSAMNGRHWVAAGLGVLCAAGNPVAALFLSLIGCAVFLSRALPRRISAVLIVAPLLPVLLVTVLFPEGGDFPFPVAGAVNTLLATALVVACGHRYVVLRWAALGYAALGVICTVFATPVGGNVARLAAIAAPVVLVMVATVRREVVAALLVPLIVLQWAPISLAVSGDRAQTEASFYRPLLDVLATRDAPLRVEVVPVATHTEADLVARAVPLARGWSRQLDRKYDALFYADHLDPAAYLRWLQELGVSIVAIADTPLDVAGRREAELLVDPPAYLHEIHHDDVWRVFEVVPQPSLVQGAATMTALDVDSFTIDATAAGPVTVKVRFSPWFHVVAGAGCVRPAHGGWTEVDAGIGTIRVEARLSLAGLVHRHGTC